MTRADVRAAAPYLGIATAVVSVVAFAAVLLGVSLTGPGQQLNAQATQIKAVSERQDSIVQAVSAEHGRSAQILDGLGRLACRQNPADAALAGLPCGAYLMERLGLPVPP